MSAIGAPSLDYRRFLSDAGSGLVALVSLVIVTYICGNNGECDFEFITTLYDWFIRIFPSLENNTGVSDGIIILTIIILSSLMLGFIVNALSYLLLNDLIDHIADNVIFQKILRSLGSVSYYGIAEFSDHFDSIDYHFRPENLLSDCKNKKYAKCIGEIKTRVSIERPDSFRYWGEVEGGRIMFRNFIFIILFCLSIIFLFFSQIVTALAIITILALMHISLKFIPKSKDYITHFLHFILLTFMVPLLIIFIPIVHDPSGFLGLSKLGLEIIVISISSLNILFFLSAFALTYYHYHIFIAAMYVSLDKRWK